jgi:hypothetical protein
MEPRIQSESAPGVDVTDANANKLERPASPEEARPSNVSAGDGSIAYRVAAMIAMLLLAIAALVVWYYFR